MTDLFLDSENDFNFLNGDFRIDESEMQDVAIILELNQGELKSDPILGPNLITMINAKANDKEIQQRVKLHLQRDNKVYEDIKDKIQYGV